MAPSFRVNPSAATLTVNANRICDEVEVSPPPDQGKLIELDAYRLRKLRRKLRWAVRCGIILVGRFRPPSRSGTP